MVLYLAQQNNDRVTQAGHPVPFDQCESGSEWPPGTRVVLKAICLFLGTACNGGRPTLWVSIPCHF